MAANEKFNNLIAEIEEQVTSEIKSARDIYFDVSRSQGLQPRDLSTVFSFLTNITLYEYIKSRKLTAAYSYLIAGKDTDVSKAIEIADYSDQPSFIKAFKKMFGCTPKEAAGKKDPSKISPPLSWAMLSSDFASVSYDKETENMQEKTFFGVPESSFAKITRALDLEAFYGLSKMFSNYAFELAEKTGHTLEDTFAYADSLLEYGGEYTDNPEGLSPEEALRRTGDNPVFQKIYFETKIDVSVISELIHDYGASEEDLLHCTMEMLNLYPGFETGVEMSFPYFVKAYKYYESRIPIDVNGYYWFDEYLDDIMAGVPIEKAFENVYPYAASDYDYENGDFTDYSTLDMEEEERMMEAYSVLDALDEEQQIWRGIRIDEDYDPDNAGFEELDREDSD